MLMHLVELCFTEWVDSPPPECQSRLSECCQVVDRDRW